MSNDTSVFPVALLENAVTHQIGQDKKTRTINAKAAILILIFRI